MAISVRELPRRVDYEGLTALDHYVSLPIGEAASGPLWVDLARLPHLLVAGNTGGGKTNWLRVAAVALIEQGCAVAVIDLKGLDFVCLGQRALVVDTVLDARELLLLLNREHDKRRDLLKRANCVKLQEFQEPLPWVALIIDELAELTDQESQKALNRLARLSRATGISILCATQRPSHTLFAKFTDTRTLFSARLCFTMPKAEDSALILGNDAASRIPRDIPGRAIWQWDVQREVQTYYSDVKTVLKRLRGLPHKEVFDIELRGPRLAPR